MRGVTRLVLALAAFLSPVRGLAAELKVLVVNARGQPVADAVVMVREPGGTKGPIHFSWPLVVEQKDMQFRPFVLVAPVGGEVAFPNHDSSQHHVYSFSPAKTFELKLYGRDETRRVRFDKAGVVSLGCNIHDDMSGFIRVVDTPYAGKTDAKGEVVIKDLPPQTGELSVWHPYLRGGRDLTRSVTPGAGALTIKVELKPAPMPHGGY